MSTQTHNYSFLVGVHIVLSIVKITRPPNMVWLWQKISPPPTRVTYLKALSTVCRSTEALDKWSTDIIFSTKAMAAWQIEIDIQQVTPDRL